MNSLNDLGGIDRPQMARQQTDAPQKLALPGIEAAPKPCPPGQNGWPIKQFAEC